MKFSGYSDSLENFALVERGEEEMDQLVSVSISYCKPLILNLEMQVI